MSAPPPGTAAPPSDSGSAAFAASASAAALPAGRRPRALVLCCDGLYQRWLVQRASEELELVGVVVQHPPHRPAAGRLERWRRYRDPRALVRQLRARAALPAYERRGEALRQQLFCPNGQAPRLPPGVPVLHTQAINGPETVAFLRRHSPDLLLVNGTQLLRQPLLDLLPSLPLGIVNLHTGLSPYSRGANCNLYMVLEGHPELVGVTVHHIDPGIDSGDIIRSAQVPLQADDNFETIDVRSFHTGIELLLAAVGDLARGRAARVPQWEKGKLFLRRTGYHYEPWQRLAASRLLEGGLLADYLAHRSERDAGVRLVGPLGEPS
jgi:methionyl-tRNA formyltransferase